MKQDERDGGSNQKDDDTHSGKNVLFCLLLFLFFWDDQNIRGAVMLHSHLDISHLTSIIIII